MEWQISRSIATRHGPHGRGSPRRDRDTNIQDWRRYLVCGTLLQCIRRSTLSPARDISSRTLTQRSLLLIQLSSLSSKTELYFRKLIQLSQFGDLTTLIATAFCTTAVDRKCFTGPGCICTLRPHHPLGDVSRRR
ncbi:uncharacterized protein LACBIDRAFT_303993 [Laccaria bicolor S238N-H82]|uniref:Predicted protein n=1 Tax=Laccaria bicolor (strain S238N-H82 / ATCC MYA-4686) TaxID=486041 RepID=B0DKQ6_LACBS|nr:uncharacterized protein LACBIDRAFT_303993 [Laccaria bicolor S238N-H82]EDR04687.1 predicted protein [Laccaria bicolor S238N-H82]|eukprot:XP_001884511.1 predicted protein [Laccaria bicolor S238N-H82]